MRHRRKQIHNRIKFLCYHSVFLNFLESHMSTVSEARSALVLALLDARLARQRRTIIMRDAKQARLGMAATTRADRAAAKQARLDVAAAKRVRPPPHRPTFAEIAQQVNDSCVAQASIDARGPDPDVLAYVMHMGATRRVQRMRALSAVAACTPVALTRADVVRRAIAAGTPAPRAQVGAVGVAYNYSAALPG